MQSNFQFVFFGIHFTEKKFQANHLDELENTAVSIIQSVVNSIYLENSLGNFFSWLDRTYT
jgi:hypothetical protein